jgi:hypothetical protein
MVAPTRVISDGRVAPLSENPVSRDLAPGRLDGIADTDGNKGPALWAAQYGSGQIREYCSRASAQGNLLLSLPTFARFPQPGCIFHSFG